MQKVVFSAAVHSQCQLWKHDSTRDVEEEMKDKYNLFRTALNHFMRKYLPCEPGVTDMSHVPLQDYFQSASACCHLRAVFFSLCT